MCRQVHPETPGELSLSPGTKNLDSSGSPAPSRQENAGRKIRDAADSQTATRRRTAREARFPLAPGLETVASSALNRLQREATEPRSVSGFSRPHPRNRSSSASHLRVRVDLLRLTLFTGRCASVYLYTNALFTAEYRCSGQCAHPRICEESKWKFSRRRPAGVQAHAPPADGGYLAAKAQFSPSASVFPVPFSVSSFLGFREPVA